LEKGAVGVVGQGFFGAFSLVAPHDQGSTMGYDNFVLCGATTTTTAPPQFSTASFEVLITALFYIGLDWKNAIWVGPCNPPFHLS
jgi:hypothetical protein